MDCKQNICVMRNLQISFEELFLTIFSIIIGSFCSFTGLLILFFLIFYFLFFNSIGIGGGEIYIPIFLLFGIPQIFSAAISSCIITGF
jgi:hypothetical protein